MIIQEEDVKNMENRIVQLEAQNKELRNEISELKGQVYKAIFEKLKLMEK